jgi:hypothetical protein
VRFKCTGDCLLALDKLGLLAPPLFTEMVDVGRSVGPGEAETCGGSGWYMLMVVADAAKALYGPGMVLCGQLAGILQSRVDEL